ncbi:hypothetical protein BaRGS_00014742, partial [Batillaria attramentaria]
MRTNTTEFIFQQTFAPLSRRAEWSVLSLASYLPVTRREQTTLKERGARAGIEAENSTCDARRKPHRMVTQIKDIPDIRGSVWDMECPEDVTVVSASLSTVGPMAYVGLKSGDLSPGSSASSSSSSLISMTLCEVVNATDGAGSSTWDTASPLSPLGDIAVASYLILADILAVCFNLTVIVISIRHRKSLNHSDAFVALLATSDLGHPLLGYPMVISASLNHGWNFGHL